MFKKKKPEIESGKIYSINNASARGHPGIIKRKKNYVEYITYTHSNFTQGVKNIKLHKNPNKKDFQPAYVRPKKYKTQYEKIGLQKKGHKITNKRDKSLIRKIFKYGKL